MDSVKLAFIPHTEQLSQICKVYQNPHNIFINLVYGRSLYVKFWLCILNLNEVPSILMLKKSINRLLFSIIIFLCFISHLLQFWTYKQLLYTKLEEMLYGFCRTWPFLAICYRAWAIGLEASPLFYCPLLIHVVNFPQTLTFWGLESIHNIYNVPSEPERAGRRRDSADWLRVM